VGSGGGFAPLMLTGGYRMLGQASNRTGTFQEKPPDLWRFELTPTLSLYGLPLTANILVSSEQQGIQQQINAFSLTFDPQMITQAVTQRAYAALNQYAQTEAGQLLQDFDAVKDSLAQYHPDQLQELEQYKKLQDLRDVSNGDISSYTSVLEDMGLMSSVESAVRYLPTVGYGTVFPTYTPLTLNGARIQGGFAEWNPGGTFYVAAAYGTTQQPLARVDSFRVDTTFFRTQDNSDFGRTIVAGRLGFGQRDGEHVIFSGVYLLDDKNSLPPLDSLSGLTPQKNIVGSMHIKLVPIEGVWTLEGEVSGSITVGDLNAPQFSLDGAPNFLLDLIDSSASSYADLAFSGATTVTIRSTGTRITGSIRQIGSGYRALGVPNLRTDYLRYDVRADQSFLRRQLTMGVFARRDRDNLIPIKRATTSLESIGASVGLNFRGWPYLRASYAPYVQESDALDTLLQFRNETTLLNVTLGHSYRIGTIQANTNVTFGQQRAATKNAVADYQVYSYQIMQTINFVFPLSISAGGGYIEQQSSQAPTATIVTVDGGLNYQISDMISASGTITLALDQVYGNRTGYSLGFTAILPDIADIDLRAERNIFNEFFNPAVLGGNYTENIFRLTISKQW
jgi:hypothetical protein